MKIVKSVIFYIRYYIIGYLLFNIIFSSTHLLVTYILGMKENVGKVILNSFKNNLIVYTILFIIIFLVNLIYNISLTKKLNEKLNKIKKEGVNNEK